MTERRAHWDDELIEAVRWCCGAIDCRPAAPCWCCEVYRADVEVERLTAELADRNRRIEAALRVLDTSQTDIAAELERLERAEAAIARVREFLADKDEGLTDDARAQGHFILVDTDSVRRALDGDA